MPTFLIVNHKGQSTGDAATVRAFRYSLDAMSRSIDTLLSQRTRHLNEFRCLQHSSGRLISHQFSHSFIFFFFFVIMFTFIQSALTFSTIHTCCFDPSLKMFKCINQLTRNTSCVLWTQNAMYFYFDFWKQTDI